MNNNIFDKYTIDEVRELCKHIKPLFSYIYILVGHSELTINYINWDMSCSVTFNYLEIATWLNHSSEDICSVLSSHFLEITNKPLYIELCEFFEDLPEKSQEILSVLGLKKGDNITLLRKKIKALIYDK